MHIAVVRNVGKRSRRDGNLAAVHRQFTRVNGHAVVGGQLAGRQCVGEGVLLAALVGDGGKVAVGSLLAAQPAAARHGHGVVAQGSAVVLSAGSAAGQRHVAADNVLLEVVNHAVVADALVGGKRCGDRGSGVIHIVTLVDAGRGHGASRHSVAAHQTGNRVTGRRGGVVAHIGRAVVDLRAIELDGQRSRVDGQNVGAFCRGVVAVLGLHLHGQRAFAHIGNARNGSAPGAAAVGAVGDRGARSHRRHGRVAQRGAVVGLALVNTVQGQITAVGDGQFAEGCVDVVEAGHIASAAHHLDAGAEGVGHGALGHVGDGAADSDVRDDIAIVQGHIRAGGAVVALRTEGHLEAVVAMSVAVVCPAVAVGGDLQRGVDLLDGGGSCSVAAVGVSHRQAVGTVSQVADGVLACRRPRLCSRSGTRQGNAVVGHTTGDSVVEEAVGLTVAVAGRGVDGQGDRCRHRDSHGDGILVAAEVLHIDLHGQGLLGGGQGDGGTISRALRHFQVSLRCAHIGGGIPHAGGEIRISVGAARDISGQRGGVARGDDRLALVAAFIGDGFGHGRAAVGDGVGVGNLPIAIVGLGLGQRGGDGQLLAAGGRVEGLHHVIGREGGSGGVASIHIVQVGWPRAYQLRSRRCGDVVGIGPVVRVVARTIRVGPSVGLGAGAAVVGAASHRAGDGQVAAVGGRGGGRCGHHRVGSAGYVFALVGGQREGALGDGIDIVPRGGEAGAVGISIGIGACALAGQRTGVVRGGGKHTRDDVFALASSRRDAGRGLGTVHAHHRLGSLNARGVHGGRSGTLHVGCIFPHIGKTGTVGVGISVDKVSVTSRGVIAIGY